MGLETTEGGKPERKEKQELSYQFLRGTFNSEQFRTAFSNAVTHTVRNESEAGFMVMKSGTRPEVSNVVMTPPRISIEDMEKSLTVNMDALFRNPVPLPEEGRSEDDDQFEYLNPWVLDGDFRDISTSDVRIILHTHPTLGRNLQDVMTPSSGDLNGWDEHNKARFKNPFIINGIIGGDGIRAGVFLYQADPSQKQILYYQQWEKGIDPTNTLLRYMRDGGIRYETLYFDRRKDQFPKSELQKLQTFVVSSPTSK